MKEMKLLCKIDVNKRLNCTTQPPRDLSHDWREFLRLKKAHTENNGEDLDTLTAMRNHRWWHSFQHYPN